MAGLTRPRSALSFWRKTAARAGSLLLWSGLCFTGLTLSNLLVFVDLFVFPQVNLYPLRLLTAAAAMLLLLYGLIWKAKTEMLEGFLLGVIATASFVAGFYFLKFWKSTRDRFFLLFAAYILVEGLNRASFLLLTKPNEGSPRIYLVRLVSFLLILVAILRKNYGKQD